MVEKAFPSTICISPILHISFTHLTCQLNFASAMILIVLNNFFVVWALYSRHKARLKTLSFLLNLFSLKENLIIKRFELCIALLLVSFFSDYSIIKGEALFLKRLRGYFCNNLCHKKYLPNVSLLCI